MNAVRAFVAIYLKKAVALLLDLYTSFVGFGFAVGYLSNAITDGGITLTNSGAAVTFLLMAAYFFAGAQTGGTPWQRFLGTRDTAKAG
jgi:hypothetical protein